MIEDIYVYIYVHIYIYMCYFLCFFQRTSGYPNQYGWSFPYGSLYRAEPHAPLLGGGAEEFNNWNSPWWRPSPVDAEPSDMVSCLEQSESWAKMTNGEFSLLNWFLNSYSGQSCSYTFLHVWMFHKVFFNKYFPKQRLRWRVLYIVSKRQARATPDPKLVAQDSRPPDSIYK